MKRNKLYWIIPAIIIAPFLMVLFGYVTMWLWNWLVPTLFHGPEITFWQTVGLIILSRILFGGFGKGHWGKGHRWKREMWRHRWEEKMKNMTPEERNRFNDYCCGHGYWNYTEKNNDNKTENAG